MTNFEIPSMSCGHCVDVIGCAVAAVDAGARLRFDLPARRVSIDSDQLSSARLREAIEQAGYPAVLLTDASGATAAAATRAEGGCCEGIRRAFERQLRCCRP
jgi:copper chaperone